MNEPEPHTVLQDPMRSANGAIDGQAVTAGPWRRFFARVIDMTVIGLPTGFLIGLVGGFASLEFAIWIQRPVSQMIFGWLLVPVILGIEALIYRKFATTLGKSILAIRVLADSGQPVDPGQYTRRLFGVYWAGLGTGFPLINLFAMAYQYDRLRKEKRATYDEGRFEVRAPELGFARVTLAVVLIAGMFWINLLLQGFPGSTDQAWPEGFEWTNEITGQVVSIPPGWIHERQVNVDEQAVEVFTHPGIGVFAVFAVEELGEGFSLDDYAGFWAQNSAATMALSVPGSPMEVNGRPALHITGEITDDQSQRIDAVVVKQDEAFWRVLLLGAPGRDPASDEAEELRGLLFASIQ